ncbi:MAG: hypothetical protein ABI763_11590 [Bacteroidota bacterium]
MKQLLQAKTLNLFITLYCPKILSLIIDPKIFAIALTLNVLQYLTVLGYFYFLAIELKNKLNPEISISNRLFNICLLIAFALLCLRNFISDVPDKFQNDPVVWMPLLITVIFLLYIYAHLGQLLTSVERDEKIRFGDHLWESLLFLIFGLGIWALQPRIRNIFTETKEIQS